MNVEVYTNSANNLLQLLILYFYTTTLWGWEKSIKTNKQVMLSSIVV